MWMNPAKKIDQFRKTEKFIEHECCKWNKQIKVFKALKVNLFISLPKGEQNI